MGRSAKKKLSLKTDFIPAKFILFILPFVVEALIGFFTMGSGDTLSVLIWSMFVFLFGIGIFPLAAKIFSRFGSGGFIISQALGIILTSLLVWTLTYLNIGMFNLPFIIGAYAVI